MPNVARHPSRVTRHALPYFPGCALKDQAGHFEASAMAAMEALGWELSELPRWNCCGTVYSLASDDLMRHLGPVRNLVRVQELGESRLITLCAMCYNTLRRSSQFVGADPERLERINAFMDEEPDYQGGVEVLHLLQFLRDEVGFEEIAAKVKRPLDGLRVAPYYGCMLLRPREVGIDAPDSPGVMEGLLSALGAEPVDFPQKAECCGAYLTVTDPEIARERVEGIVSAARRAGAEIIATSCPLCQFNLEHHQADDASPVTRHASPVTVVYFTQLLALALGVPGDKLGFERLRFDPRPHLAERELV
ncbi:CoB--CoM heterodisulfide reductase iron-sulfur subunit B family protein [Candidatus Bipolaricaulota bacterium]|nr:CoB--CoM heterodisulfide reductase iron-sulfur subunit B family protein [Candidatus Bipolaricaulota bacterium]